MGRRAILLIVGLALLGIGGLWYGRDRGMASPTPAAAATAAASATPAIPVVDGQVEARDVPIWLSGIGSVQPLNAVTVKVRVDGQLERVAFIEGQDVRAGDLLAQIDARLYRAQLKQAQASKVKDEAQRENIKLDLARYSKLETSGVTPVRNVEALKAQLAGLEATVEADQAQIAMAQLQLDFTTVTAPIDGRVGLKLVDAGSIVHASDANGLVTVTQMQPIAAVFTLSQDELPEVLAAMAEGDVAVIAYTRAGDKELARGKLVFIDSQVDQSTGQVKLKALFDNRDRALWPGEFIAARLLVKTIRNAVVVPARAVQRGQSGSYAFRIKADSTVEVQPVTVAAVSEGIAIVATGLSAGERIVVDGQYRLQAGSRVEAGKGAGSPSRQ